MKPSAAGDSGLGDEGEEGIEWFRAQHICNQSVEMELRLCMIN
jgi:hypothetical protein